MFGGDLFSASESLSKPSSSSMPTQTASIPPVSSAIVPATSEPQTPAKINPLGALNAFTRQPTGAPVQSAGPSLPRLNQQARLKIQKEHRFPTHHYLSGQKMTRAGVNKYIKVFMEVDSDKDGKITGYQARSLCLSWRLPIEILKQVWDLSVKIMERYKEGQNLPPTLPSSVSRSI